MLQNPHHYPCLASCSLTDVVLPYWCRTARLAPTNTGGTSPAGPCCTGAGRAGANERRWDLADGALLHRRG